MLRRLATRARAGLTAFRRGTPASAEPLARLGWVAGRDGARVGLAAFGKRSARLSPASVSAALGAAPRLAECARELKAGGRPDLDRVRPDVLGVLVSLVRAAHAGPGPQNVYMAPGDEHVARVLIAVGGDRYGPERPPPKLCWVSVSADKIAAILLAEAAGALRALCLTLGAFPPDEQALVVLLPVLYDKDPGYYAREGRAALIEHLRALAPAGADAKGGASEASLRGFT